MTYAFLFERNDDTSLMARAQFPGRGEVQVVSAPSSAIGGALGPVVVEGFSTETIIVVFAEERIQALLDDPLLSDSQKMDEYRNLCTIGVEAGRGLVGR